ncbi:hypothetical protein D8I24_1143 [Cupriavidus necator H850]|nr:hypothetical protein D8I24_1143 [Cupriavidus necator H850]
MEKKPAPVPVAGFFVSASGGFATTGERLCQTPQMKNGP